MNTSTIDWRERAARLAVDGRALIAGRRVDARDGRSFDCVSPIDGRALIDGRRVRASRWKRRS